MTAKAGAKVPMKVFLVIEVHAVLYADAGIGLAKRGGRQAKVANTAVSGCGCVSHGIEQGSTTDGSDKAMTADPVAFDVCVDTIDDIGIVLEGFSALKCVCAHQPEIIFVVSEIALDLTQQVRIRLANGFIDVDQDFSAVSALAGAGKIPEQRVGGVEYAFSEVDPELVGYLNGVFNG